MSLCIPYEANEPKNHWNGPCATFPRPNNVEHGSIHDAQQELVRAVVWYDERRSGLGDELVEAVALRVEDIRECTSRPPRADDADDADELYRALNRGNDCETIR
jgi:hypothetical protein